MLVIWLFQTSSVGNEFFYHIKVHERLSPKEIHFEVAAASGIFHQKVQCLFSNFITHQRTVSMILALAGKTITAGEGAGMRDVKAQRFYHGLAFFEVNDTVFVRIFGKQRAVFPHFFQILIQFFHFLFFYFRIFFQNFRCDLCSFFRLIHPDHIICHIIHDVDRATVYI